MCPFLDPSLLPPLDVVALRISPVVGAARFAAFLKSFQIGMLALPAQKLTTLAGAKMTFSNLPVALGIMLRSSQSLLEEHFLGPSCHSS